MFVVASALVQEYPVKPVVMLVPFAAGGPTDIVARSLALGMGKALKQTLVVEINDLLRGQVDILCDQTTNTTQ